MADSPCFERTCEVLEADTALGRLEARGTIRLALKAAGLDPRSVSPAQMGVVVDKLLAGELRTRGVQNGDAVCAALRQMLLAMQDSDVAETPEAIFARIGGS
jgi:hypothetical protein